MRRAAREGQLFRRMEESQQLEKLIEMVKSDPSLIAGTEVVLMPMANPDGMLYTETNERFHRKNTNGVENAGWFCTGGVDLNRNYDVNFGGQGSSSNRCQEIYSGPGPNSEKETQVVIKVMKEAPMDVFIDVHAYTALILASWGYTRDDHPRAAEFASLGLKMKASIDGKHGVAHSARAGATSSSKGKVGMARLTPFFLRAVQRVDSRRAWSVLS